MTKRVCDVCGAELHNFVEKGEHPVSYFYIQRSDVCLCSKKCIREWFDKWVGTDKMLSTREITIKEEVGQIRVEASTKVEATE